MKKEAKIQEDQVVLVSQYENRIADLENQLRDAMKSQSSSAQNQEEYNAVLQKSELLAQRLASMEVTVHLLLFSADQTFFFNISSFFFFSSQAFFSPSRREIAVVAVPDC